MRGRKCRVATTAIGVVGGLWALTALAADAQAKTWRVGLLGEDPPFSDVRAVGPTGRGLYVEWWRALAEAAGAALQLVPCPTPKRCLADLREEHIDFLGPRRFVPDPELAFTRPVNRRFTVAASLGKSLVRDPRDLRDLKVILLNTSLAEQKEVRAWSPSAVEITSSKAAARALGHKGHDVVVFSGVRDSGLASLNGLVRTPLWFRWHHIYARSDHAAELAGIDELIDQLDTRDTRLGPSAFPMGLDELRLEPTARPTVSFEAMALLAEHPTLRLGAAPWEPLTVLEDGIFDGLALRVVGHHLRRAGVTPVFEGSENWAAVEKDALARRLDGLGYVVVNPGAPKGYIYSDKMLDLPMVVVTRGDQERWSELADLRGRRIVTNPNYGEVKLQLKPLLAGDIIYESEGARALARLRSNTADAWVEYLPVARHLIRLAGATDVRLAFRIGGPRDARTALHKEFAPLLALVDHSIATTQPRELEAIYSGWSGRAPVAATPSRTPPSVFYVFASLIGILVIGVVVLSRQVRREGRTVRQRERALRRAQLLSGVGSFELDPPYTRILLDGETPRLLGLPNELEGQDWAAHFALFKDAAALRTALATCQSSAESVQLDVSTRGDSPKVFSYEFAPPRNIDGREGVIAGTVEDVTEERLRSAHEKELEEEVLHLQKLDAIGRLAGGIAHDFNNVLAATMANAELARDDLDPRHPARECIDQILKASERARDLVAQILAFSRRDVERHVSLRLDGIVREAVTFMRASIPATVRFETNISDVPAWVRGDDSRLTQVLVNLITNAVDAVAQGTRSEAKPGSIRVSLDVLDRPPHPSLVSRLGPVGVARLAVEDNGPGISDAIRGRVFDPFFTTKPVGKGTGLGLSIVHGVVRAHGGTTEVEMAPDGGARFVVLLPVAEETKVDKRETPVALEAQGESVLIVDDEVALTSAFSRSLSQCGLRVTTFNSPKKAKDVFLADPGRFDLVLTDLTMPELTGDELARSLLEIRPGLPILLTTGYGESEPGASHNLFRTVLRKPVATRELVAAVLAELSEARVAKAEPVPERS